MARLPQGPERPRRELELWLAPSAPLIATKGYARRSQMIAKYRWRAAWHNCIPTNSALATIVTEEKIVAIAESTCQSIGGPALHLSYH